jgi:hypothetical protein
MRIKIENNTQLMIIAENYQDELWISEFFYRKKGRGVAWKMDINPVNDLPSGRDDQKLTAIIIKNLGERF